VALLFFPDTLHKPLEETAAMFGDDEEVIIFQRCIEKDNGSESISVNEAPGANSLEVENIASVK
jgi:hypothetical protein